MNERKFEEIINHIWSRREYLIYCYGFDYPFYGGLKSGMVKSDIGRCKLEDVQAMQNIWNDFRKGKFKSKRKFSNAYRKSIIEMGGKVTQYKYYR